MESFGRDLQGVLAGQSTTLINGMSNEALRDANAIGAQSMVSYGDGNQANAGLENAPGNTPDSAKTLATMGLAHLVRSSLNNRAETVTAPRISGDVNLRRLLLPVGVAMTILAAAATYFCWPKSPIVTASAPPKINRPVVNDTTLEGEAFEDEIVAFDGKFPQHQYPSTELLSQKPFCAMIDDNNVKYRYFDFPKDVVIGIMTSDHQPKPFKAYGRFKIAQSDWLTFIPTDAAEHSPGCFKRFSANDINCVRLDPPYPQDALLEQVADIPELQMLDLENCQGVTASGAENLARFKKLKTLDAAYSSVDGAMLSGAHLYKTLEDLNLARLKSPRPFLNQLGRFKHLQRLIIKETKLNDADIAAIASLPKLYFLDVSESPISREQLQTLTHTANLTELGLHECGIGINDVDILRGFKLHNLYIKGHSVNQSQLEKLKKLFPKVGVY